MRSALKGAIPSAQQLRRRAEYRLLVRGWHPRGLAREEVIWAYRILLEREPESRAVVEEKLEVCRTLAHLRQDILGSEEYRRANPDTALQKASTVVITEVEGLGRLFVDLADTGIGLEVLRRRYEPTETAFVTRSLGDGMCFLDLGANIGYYSLLAASRVGSAGHVLAFEPLASNAELLERSVAENRMADRVRVHRVGVSDTTGHVNLVLAEGARNSGGAFISSDTSIGPGMTATEIPTVRLDDLELPPVDFMKIDVEGAELLAIKGARGLLERDRPLIMCELHRRQLRRVSRCEVPDVISELRSFGYEARQLRPDGLGPTLTDVASDHPETVAFVQAG